MWVDPEVGEETVDHEINVLLQKGNATREWLVNLAMGQELKVMRHLILKITIQLDKVI